MREKLYMPHSTFPTIGWWCVWIRRRVSSPMVNIEDATGFIRLNDDN